MAKMKPLYVFSGFLDAGKTTAIKESLLDPQFNQGETTLIIAFEQGDEEYDEDFLFNANAYVVYLDDIKELDKKKIDELDDEYYPDRIILELNGMQDDQELFRKDGSSNWLVVDYLTFFDATVLKNQMLNMRQFVYNHVIDSAICYINRCDGQDLMYFRNNLKGINRNMMVVFLDMDSKMIKIEQQMFDTEKPLDIADNDYGLWYIDAVDDPEKYDGCQITMKVKHLETLKEYENVCIMGRQAMVCCSNDLQQIGLTCTDVDPKVVEDGRWYYLSGKLKAIDDEQGGRTVILNTGSVTEAPAPEDEYVNFN
ncbi:MAG: hypothetical protein IKE93_00155 [Erysipelotrichaceae bacterium]|nr:hypothetical protein [Erysipelotrichaceae bacterium]